MIVFGEKKTKIFRNILFHNDEFCGDFEKHLCAFIPREQVARYIPILAFYSNPPATFWFRFSMRQDSTGRRVSVKAQYHVAQIHPFCHGKLVQEKSSRSAKIVTVESLVHMLKKKKDLNTAWFPEVPFNSIVNHNRANIKIDNKISQSITCLKEI